MVDHECRPDNDPTFHVQVTRNRPLTPQALRDIATLLDEMDDTLCHLIQFAPNASDHTKAAVVEMFSGDDLQQDLRRWATDMEEADHGFQDTMGDPDCDSAAEIGARDAEVARLRGALATAHKVLRDLDPVDDTSPLMDWWVQWRGDAALAATRSALEGKTGTT